MTFESDEKRLKKGTEILKKLNFLHKAEGSFLKILGLTPLRLYLDLFGQGLDQKFKKEA